MSMKYIEQMSRTGVCYKKFKSDFGAKILGKFGWKEGEGLGKQKDGITEAIQIKRREENMGLGKNKNKTVMNDKWWQDSYDNILKGMKVHNNKNMIKNEIEESSEEESPKKSKKTSKNKNSRKNSINSKKSRKNSINSKDLKSSRKNSVKSKNIKGRKTSMNSTGKRSRKNSTNSNNKKSTSLLKKKRNITYIDI